ncbi:MAG: sugar phosphate nucleotidyltransferase [Bacteroidota bacterium]|nr:sugar phosphate nucleotidyltransferase [Bacteroidota bacterium]
MKVVLFCGGMGMRIREFSDLIPKPMVPVGNRPILWNIMRYYAHYGHKDFILCLGYKGEVIKEYFLNYRETFSNDFVLSQGGKNVELLNSDIHDWRITFVDTGLKSNIGMRLKAAEKYLDGETEFLANYTDGLTDLPLDKVIEHFHQKDKIASFVSVKPSQSFDVVKMKNEDDVEGLVHITKHGLWINAGFFTFKKEIFDYIKEGEELVYEPFKRLIANGQVTTYKHDGFFLAMDTFKEKQEIDDMSAQGNAKWEVWKNGKK